MSLPGSCKIKRGPVYCPSTFWPQSELCLSEKRPEHLRLLGSLLATTQSDWSRWFWILLDLNCPLFLTYKWYLKSSYTASVTVGTTTYSTFALGIIDLWLLQPLARIVGSGNIWPLTAFSFLPQMPCQRQNTSILSTPCKRNTSLCSER